MNIIISFFTSLLVFLHIITPVSAPIYTPLATPSAIPIVSQQPVQKPVVMPVVTPKPVITPKVDSSKCKLEATLAVDNLSDAFILSSETKLGNNPQYREFQLIQKAKLQKLTTYEVGVFSTAYARNVVEHRIPSELDELHKTISEQLIGSQKTLQDNFNQLIAQQYNLFYLQCINR